jgi:hypothetical protein
MPSNEKIGTSVTPEQQPINQLQQNRLASLTGIDPKELAGQNITQLSDQLKSRIDPHLFFFRKVCGKVVKKDPVTGIEYPVPFATVYVEDTDCNFITFAPPYSPWCWHFPLWCTREVIATVKTDACGNFCVWIPYFDIDWVLRWYKERICFPIIFKRPTIGDLIPKIPIEIPKRWPPVPGPDPGPIDVLTSLSPSTIEAMAGSQAAKLANEVTRTKNSQAVGQLNTVNDAVLNQRVFAREVPPPFSKEFQRGLSGQGVIASKEASAVDAFRSAVADKLRIDANAKELAQFDYQRYIGPFYKCYDFYFPEWQIVLDVPDITFRVTQDTNSDGVEETIYSESYFDVRWDSGSIYNVTLVASSIAKESRLCNAPPVPCGDIPAILFAGFMRLNDPSYFDDVTGYALRPNRPKPDPRPVAKTPFCYTIQLYGCVDVNSAVFYRILQSIDNGANFSAITGLSWNNYLSAGGSPIPIVADSSGWYPVNPINPITSAPAPRNTLEFPNLLLDWPSQDGNNVLKIELGDAGKAHIADSPNVAIVADNSAPSAPFSKLSWKFVGEPDSALRDLLGIPCPLIKRGASPADIELVFEVHVTATHLRDATLWTSGCGGGSFVGAPDALNNPSHWHETVFDNSETLYQRYSLSHAALPGCYSFGCYATSRAMNPSGADGGNLLPTDWFYDPVYIYVNPSISVAVVNEN